MFAPKVAKPQAKAAENSIGKLAPRRPAFVGHPLRHDPVERALFLQRTIGNQATLRLLAQRGPAPPGNRRNSGHKEEIIGENAAAETISRGLSWDFSKIPVFPPDRANRVQSPFPPAATPICGALQARLVVGHANDPLEHEADRVADHVMRLPAPDSAGGRGQVGSSVVQRACAACKAWQDSEDEVRRVADISGLREPFAEQLVTAFLSSQGTVQRQATSHENADDTAAGKRILMQAKLANPQPGAELEAALGSLEGRGEPLPDTARDDMEGRFGHDFSRVRIHADASAARLARQINARAFTIGRNVAFASGEYAPNGTAGSRRLLAHELTHVIQQGDTGTPMIQRQPEIEMPAEDIPAEPRLIKSRPSPTDWIREPSPSGSLDEKQWAEGLKANDIAKLYADIAKVAQSEKVFEGPAAVPKISERINIVNDARSGMTPGLDFSPFFMDRGGTFFVNAEGGKPFVGYNPSRADPLPKVAIVLSKEAFSTKSVALGVLRHEMMHAEHLTMVLKEAQKWRADTTAKSGSFEDWLTKQNTKGRLSDLNLLLIKDQLLAGGQTAPRSANTELLSYTEEFMTEFLLMPSAPADNHHPAFLPLYGVITSSNEPWANANTSARAEALGRLQQYFCHVLNRPHQDAFKKFVSGPPTTQMPNVSWDWAPKRQMHQHFFEGLKKIINNTCQGVGSSTK